MQPCHARYCKAKAVSSRSRIAHVKLTTSEAGILGAMWKRQKRWRNIKPKPTTLTSSSSLSVLPTINLHISFKCLQCLAKSTDSAGQKNTMSALSGRYRVTSRHPWLAKKPTQPSTTDLRLPTTNHLITCRAWLVYGPQALHIYRAE